MSRLGALTRRSESNLREVARGSAITTVGSLVGAVATFGLLVLVVRGAGVDRGGLFFQAFALLSGASVLCSLGGAMHVTRGLSRVPRDQHQDASPVVWVTVLPVSIVSVAVSLAAVLAAGPLAGALTDTPHAPALETLIRVMALGVPFVVLTRVLTAVSRAVDEPAPGALYDLGGQPVLRLVTAGIAVAAGATAGGLAWSITGPAVVCCGLSAWHARRSLTRAGMGLSRPRRRDLQGYGEFIRFGLPRGLEEVVQASSTWLLTVMVGAMAGPAEAATYASLTRLTMGTGLLLQAVTTSMLPRLSASFARRADDELNEMFRTTTRWLLVISLPLCVGLVLFPGALLSIASPDLPGGRVGLQLLAVGALVNVVTGPVGGIVLMAGRSSVNLLVASVSVVAMLVLAVVLIPGSGASGAAAAWSVAIVVQNALLYGYTHWRLRLSAWTGELAGPLTLVVAWSCIPQIATRIVGGDRVPAVAVAAVLSLAGLVFVLGRVGTNRPDVG